MGRVIAIGDIHGCSAAFDAVLDAVNLRPDDLLVPLGDYVDRGPDSRGVIERLIRLGDVGPCPVMPIIGNHELMMLTASHGERDLQMWLDAGGRATLESYGAHSVGELPDEHLAFIHRCRPWFETDTHIFVHANYDPGTPLERQTPFTLHWLSLRDKAPDKRHVSGKTVVVGHTPQPEVLDLGYLIDLDTGCCKGGWLTGMDVTTGRIWQADADGNMRSPSG